MKIRILESIPTTVSLTMSQYLKTSSVRTVMLLINVSFYTVNMYDQNVQANYKTLQQNVVVNLHDLGFGNEF